VSELDVQTADKLSFERPQKRTQVIAGHRLRWNTWSRHLFWECNGVWKAYRCNKQTFEKLVRIFDWGRPILICRLSSPRLNSTFCGSCLI